MSDTSNFNLEFFRKEAKALLKQCRARDAEAIRRIRAQLPAMAKLDDSSIADQIQLADVQHAIARERGRANWAELKHADDPIERFLVAVRGGALKEAERQWALFPEMAAESIHAACAIGDPYSVRRHLDRDSALLRAERGGWQPLFYVSGSPFGRATARPYEGLSQCAALLLDRGADPNTFVLTDPSNPESKVTAAYRAMMSANLAVMMLLGKRGARFDLMLDAAKLLSKQSLMGQGFAEYFQRSDVRQEMTERMAAFRERASSSPSDMWRVMSERTARLPDSATEMFRTLLERHAFDPNQVGTDGLTYVQRIARTGTPAMVELLLAHGGDPNRLTPDGRTPLVLAIRGGNESLAQVLRAHGATDAGLRPIDEWIGACLRGDTQAAQQIVKSNPEIFRMPAPEDAEALVQAATRNDVTTVRLMAQCGFPLGPLSESGVTALHVAAWHGLVDMTRLLLEFGAPVNVRDRAYGSSPLAWAAHGSSCRDADDEYYAIADSLLNAGADRASSISRTGITPESVASLRVAELLRERWEGPRG